MPPPGGQNTIQIGLQYTVNAGQASMATKALTQDVQRLDRAAQESQKSLNRMSAADRAAQSQSGGVYGVQWGYGQMGPTQGQSKGQAYYGQNFRPTPPPLPGARYSPAMPPPGGGFGGGGGMGGQEAMMLISRTTAAAGAVIALAAAIDSMGKAALRAATAVSPGGQRLGGIERGAETVGGIPLLGPALRASTGMWEFAADNTLVGIGARRLGIDSGRRAANEDAYRSQLRLAGVGAAADAAAQIQEQETRGRNLQANALAGDWTAGQLRAGMPGFTATYLDEIGGGPALAMARMNRVAAVGNQAAAIGRGGVAINDVMAARGGVAAAQAQLATARAGSSTADTGFGAISGIAGNRNIASRAQVLEAEQQLQAQQNRLAEALKAQEQAQLDIAQKVLEVKRATVAVTQAELSLTEKNIEKQRTGGVELGLASPFAQISLRQTAQKWKTFGVGSLSQDEARELLGSALTAEEFRNEYARHQATTNPYLQGINQLMGRQGLDVLEPQREVQVKAILKVQIDEADLANQVDNIGGTIIQQLVKLFADRFGGKLRIIEQEQQMQRDQQNQ